MNRLPLPALLLVFVLPPLVGCGSSQENAGGGAPVDPAAFVVGIDHPYFPIEPGMTWTYVGDRDGLPIREEAATLPGLRWIEGVACTAVETRVFVAEVAAEIAIEWYAEDFDGNVWKFGEETSEVRGEALIPTPDSWLAGEGRAAPWIAFPAEPRAGDRFEGYRPGGPDRFEVVSTTITAEVSAGLFPDCIQMHENAEDPEDADIILYAPGVGRVSESDPSGRVELVATTGGPTR